MHISYGPPTSQIVLRPGGQGLRKNDYVVIISTYLANWWAFDCLVLLPRIELETRLSWTSQRERSHIYIYYTHVVDGYASRFVEEKGNENKKVSLGYNTKWNILNEWYSHWNLRYVIQFARKEQIKDASEPRVRSFISRGGFLGKDTVLESDLPTCPARSGSNIVVC